MYGSLFHKFLTYFDPELTIEQAKCVINKELEFINRDVNNFCNLLSEFTPDKSNNPKYDLFNDSFKEFREKIKNSAILVNVRMKK